MYKALAVTIGISLTCACSSPMGPIPGNKLEGEVVAWPEDWSFAQDIENVLLETNPMEPYSVTIWGVNHDGGFYVTAGSASSRWVENIKANSAVIIGIQHMLYKAHARQVANPALIAAIAKAYIKKYDVDEDDNFVEDDGIVFHLTPRSGGHLVHKTVARSSQVTLSKCKPRPDG